MQIKIGTNIIKENIFIDKNLILFLYNNNFKLNLKTGNILPLNEKEKSKKVNLTLLQQIHQLYFDGLLHLPKYCNNLDFKCSDRIKDLFKRNDLPLLDPVTYNRFYRGEIVSKSQNTCILKYGVNNPSKDPSIKNKAQLTCLERYNVDNPSKDPGIVGKIKETLFQKYGGIGNQVFSLKQKATMLSKYGVDHNWKGFLRENQKATMLTKYGVDHNFKSPEIRAKIKQTNLAKYGTSSPMQSVEFRRSYDKRYDNLIKAFECGPTKETWNFLIQNYSYSQSLIYLKKLGLKNPKRFTPEEQIAQILDELGLKYIRNARSQHQVKMYKKFYDLDFLIKVNENYSVGIEVNGVAFHSSNKAAFGEPKDQFYHLDKRIAFQKKGIKILGFMDFEVLDLSKKSWIISEILQAIQHPWSLEKIQEFQNSHRNQYVTTKHTYKGWEYWDYGKFKGISDCSNL